MWVGAAANQVAAMMNGWSAQPDRAGSDYMGHFAAALPLPPPATRQVEQCNTPAAGAVAVDWQAASSCSAPFSPMASQPITHSHCNSLQTATSFVAAASAQHSWDGLDAKGMSANMTFT